MLNKTKYGIYSISKIDKFKTCKRAFKYKYIDKIKVDMSFEALEKGNIVHDLLEDTILNRKIKKIDVYLKKYTSLSKEKIEECYNIYNKFLSTNTYKILNSLPYQKICEKWFYLGNCMNPVNEKEDAIFQGKIDFFVIDNKKQIGMIIDWKTGGKSLENLKKYGKDSSQLESYALWVLQKFNLKGVKAKNYFIEFDYEIENIITTEFIDKIKNNILHDINEIEECDRFVANINNLCPYCEYKDICGLGN